ncbi:hypothetical protein C0J52_02850 [Blattella germanica]|nr:hypothetical protein C0J52_02850 [Blattella germanica]PSN50299.1 hypothetical protein C0J52_02850 [Blattella germanica]
METALKKCLIIGCTGIMITTLLIINITLVVQQLSGRAISSISDSESWRRPYSPVCTSDKCILSANNLLQSMNRNVDPCEDFYKYSCGNWKKEHPIPDTFYKSSWTSDRFHVTMRKVRDFLRTEDSNESTAWKKAKMLYRSCINEDKLQSLGLKPLLKIFKTIGLRKPSQLWSDSVRPNEEWYSIAAKAKKMLALDIFIGLKIQPFFLPGTNRIILKPPSDQDFLPGFFKTDDILKIDSSFTLSEKNNKNTSEHVDIKFDQKMFILQMLIDHIALVMGEIFNKPIIAMKDDALQILGLEINTRRAASNLSMDGESLLELLETINGTQDLSDIEHKNLIQISVDDFQKFTDNGTGSSQINWKEYFRVMFEDIGVSVLGGDKIIVMQPEYFKRLATIMSSRTRKIVDMFIYWKVADLVSMHTTETIRRSTEYLNKFDTDIEATEARSMICTRVVSHTMEMATLSYIINSEISNTNELKVREMFDNIRNAFLRVINASTWLYADSKDLIKRKAEAIPLLTYPKWILDNKKLEEYYESVELTEEHFLLSAMNISKWKMEKVLSSLSTGVVTDDGFAWISQVPVL